MKTITSGAGINDWHEATKEMTIRAYIKSSITEKLFTEPQEDRPDEKKSEAKVTVKRGDYIVGKRAIRYKGKSAKK